MRRRVLLVLACPLLLLAGCGNSRTKPPDVSRAVVPHGAHRVSFGSGGISFLAPENWATLPGTSPLVVTVGSGRALVAVWRYPRREPLPSDAATLDAARLRLIDATRARYAPLTVIRSEVLTLGGQHAVEIDVIDRIAGSERRVRSLHIYAFGAELVVDEYAPRSTFRTIDHELFSPLKRSLRLFPAATA